MSGKILTLFGGLESAILRLVAAASLSYAWSMRYIPTHCEACSRTALVGSDTIVSGFASCAQCGARARALPGESYAPEDLSLFEELRGVLEQAKLSPTSASALRGELGSRSALDPGRGIKRLSQVVPALGLLELVVPGRPAAMRKAEGMLATLLDGLSRARSRSGTMSAVSNGESDGGGGSATG